jgi:hypothetical protein
MHLKEEEFGYMDGHYLAYHRGHLRAIVKRDNSLLDDFVFSTVRNLAIVDYLIQLKKSANSLCFDSRKQNCPCE